MLLDYADVAKVSGVQAVTVKEWVSILKRTALVYCLKPYASNLNKRLTKTPKFYFLDTGLAARLQGWQDPVPLMTSPQADNIALVTFGGKKIQLSKECLAIPISQLHEFLLEV